MNLRDATETRNKVRLHKLVQEAKKIGLGTSADLVEAEGVLCLMELKSLASIVLINVEACCFAEGVLLERLVQQYDEDSSGFLSHEEFKTMLGSLPLKELAELPEELFGCVRIEHIVMKDAHKLDLSGSSSPP